MSRGTHSAAQREWRQREIYRRLIDAVDPAPADRAERTLARELTARGRIIGSEGTLYPLLAHLRRNGLVETS